jgi:hypothetical protein
MKTCFSRSPATSLAQFGGISQQEWNQTHIPNSSQVPLDELQGHLSELPRDQDIVCKDVQTTFMLC